MNTSTKNEQNPGKPELKKTAGQNKVPAQLTNTNTKLSMIFQSQDNPADLAVSTLEALLAEFTDQPENIKIEKRPYGLTGTAIVMRVNRVDYGNVNGPQGAHLEGLKAVVRIISDRAHANLQLNLEEVPEGVKVRKDRMVFDDSWDRERLEGVMQIIFDQLFDQAKVVVTDEQRGESIIEVLLGATANEVAAAALAEKLRPLVKPIGFKNRRYLRLTIVKDAMLYDQLTMATA